MAHESRRFRKREMREQLNRIEAKTDRLQNELLGLIRQSADRFDEIKEALKALAAGDPAALERVTQAIDAVSAKLGESSAALKAATEGNQPPQ